MISAVSGNNFLYKNNSNQSFEGKWVSPKKGRAYIQSIKDTGAKIIYISGHTSMDQDSLDSALFLSHIVKSQGIDAKVCAKSEQLKSLYMSKNPEIHRRLKKIPELILSVDFNDILKIPKLLREMFEGKGNKIAEHKPGKPFEGTELIGVDHHIDTKTLKGQFYIDDSAKSCCGILVRIADSIGYKMTKEDAKLAYCGMLSDYNKSGLVEIENGRLIKTTELLTNKNAQIVLKKVEKLLTKEEKLEIHNYIDVIPRLTPKQKAFLKKLDSMIKVSPNGTFAHVAIDPLDKDWAKLGMDNDVTSALIRHFRKEVLKDYPEVKNVAVFYRTSPKPHGIYRVSIHSKDNSAVQLINEAESISGLDIGGGHSDRAGGKFTSLDAAKTAEFVNYFVQAAEKL